MVTNDYLLSAGLGFLPAIVWLMFFLLEDRAHPEPKKVVVRIFLVGIVSALVAAAIQLVFRDTLFTKLDIKETDGISFIILSFIEELVKFAAVYLALRKSKYLDEPLDAMIYMITGALGFAAIENTLFLLKGGSEVILETIVLRAVGATLLHALASGFVGFYWAKKRTLIGLIIAVLLHASFNYVILKFSIAPIYATAILIIASFFLFYDFDIIKENGQRQG